MNPKFVVIFFFCGLFFNQEGPDRSEFSTPQPPTEQFERLFIVEKRPKCFLSESRCQKLIGIAEEIGFTPATVHTERGHEMREDWRNNLTN